MDDKEDNHNNSSIETNTAVSSASAPIRILNYNANQESDTNTMRRRALTETTNDWVSVPRRRGRLLIPPANFGLVEKGLTRSGMPNELNFLFLKRLKLKTVLYLAHEEIPASLESFIEQEGINLMTLVPNEDEVARQWRPISEEVVRMAFDAMLDVSNYPVHVMCFGGRHRTGTMIGCVRRLQQWHLSAIFEEYQMYATNKGRLINEQFIELFDPDLVTIPPNPPSWVPSKKNS